MKQNKEKKIIGITGRTATGKSTLAGIFEQKGFTLIDADVIYHKLLKESAKMRRELIEFFGTLNGKEILNEIYKNSMKLAKLNDITHKYVTDIIKETIESNPVTKYILDVPVPVQEGFVELCDLILVTDCSEKTQVERLIRRNKINKDEAVKRMNLQMKREEYIKIGHIIINTENMNREELGRIAVGIAD